MLDKLKAKWPAIKAEAIRKALIFVIMLLVIVVFPLAILRWTAAIIQNSDKAWNISKAFDRVGNVLLNGDWQTMISTRAGAAMKEGRTWACVLCKVLDYIQKDHCENSQG